MPMSSRVLMLLPALALVAACASPERRSEPAASSTTTAVPPPLAGALGAPIAPAPPPTEATSTPLPLSGGSTAPAPVAMPGAPTRMSANEITSALSNNTAQGATTAGVPYSVYFSGDGKERFHQGDFNDVGTWRVMPDGRFCSSLARISSDNQECYIMYRNGETIRFQRPDGTDVGRVSVVPGNPEHL